MSPFVAQSRHSSCAQPMSAFGGKADVTLTSRNVDSIGAACAAWPTTIAAAAARRIRVFIIAPYPGQVNLVGWRLLFRPSCSPKPISAFGTKRTSVEPEFACDPRKPATRCAATKSLQRLEVTHHSRNKLRHRGMNMHRALHHRVGRLGVHNIENAVDDLVACDSQEGGA